MSVILASLPSFFGMENSLIFNRSNGPHLARIAVAPLGCDAPRETVLSVTHGETLTRVPQIGLPLFKGTNTFPFSWTQ